MESFSPSFLHLVQSSKSLQLSVIQLALCVMMETLPAFTELHHVRRIETESHEVKGKRM